MSTTPPDYSSALHVLYYLYSSYVCLATALLVLVRSSARRDPLHAPPRGAPRRGATAADLLLIPSSSRADAIIPRFSPEVRMRMSRQVPGSPLAPNAQRTRKQAPHCLFSFRVCWSRPCLLLIYFVRRYCNSAYLQTQELGCLFSRVVTNFFPLMAATDKSIQGTWLALTVDVCEGGGLICVALLLCCVAVYVGV